MMWSPQIKLIFILSCLLHTHTIVKMKNTINILSSQVQNFNKTNDFSIVRRHANDFFELLKLFLTNFKIYIDIFSQYMKINSVIIADWVNYASTQLVDSYNVNISILKSEYIIYSLIALPLFYLCFSLYRESMTLIKNNVDKLNEKVALIDNNVDKLNISNETNINTQNEQNSRIQYIENVVNETIVRNEIRKRNSITTDNIINVGVKTTRSGKMYDSRKMTRSNTVYDKQPEKQQNQYILFCKTEIPIIKTTTNLKGQEIFKECGKRWQTLKENIEHVERVFC